MSTPESLHAPAKKKSRGAEMANTTLNCTIRNHSLAVVIQLDAGQFASKSSMYSASKRFLYAEGREREIEQWHKVLESLFHPACIGIMDAVQVDEMVVSHKITNNTGIRVTREGFQLEEEADDLVREIVLEDVDISEIYRFINNQVRRLEYTKRVSHGALQEACPG